LTLAVGTAAAGSKQTPATIVFPVLAPATYGDHFGEPRAGGTHQGITPATPTASMHTSISSFIRPAGAPSIRIPG
jgi:hypothetical protein